jgi:hypothetical protein
MEMDAKWTDLCHLVTSEMHQDDAGFCCAFNTSDINIRLSFLIGGDERKRVL